jgi:hypothetical protein
MTRTDDAVNLGHNERGRGEDANVSTVSEPASTLKLSRKWRIKVNNEPNRRRWNGRPAGRAPRGLLVALAALAFTGIACAQDNTDVKFRGGIGVIPLTGIANGAVNLNVVRGVSPAGPWKIADLEASVEFNGHIKLTGRGLLLAAGNGIGTNAGASVHATLFCGPASSATPFDEAGVQLEPNGDFRINDFLTGNAPLPNPCENPVLLIRSGALPGQGVWFAAGIPKLEVEHATD